MHRALQLCEILFNIFGHCAPPESCWTPKRSIYTADLAAFARTCRTFKEPALDVLWSELVDLTPLVRCLPKACDFSAETYCFRRPLKEEEWNILLSYTCRIWNICGDPSHGLDNDNLIAVCSATSSGRILFPNLRRYFSKRRPLIPSVHVAVPSLTMLDMHLTDSDDEPALIDFLTAIGDRCPSLARVQFRTVEGETPSMLQIVCRQISRWKNLRVLAFHGLAITPGMVSDLSESFSLRNLNCLLIRVPRVTDWILASDLLPTFPTLRRLEMTSTSLHSITGFLSCTRLPVLEDLRVASPERPSRNDFLTHLGAVRNACSPERLTNFTFCGGSSQSPGGRLLSSNGLQLTLDDLCSLMEFVSLHQVRVDLEWAVGLTDEDMLTLLSAWPLMKRLHINERYGCTTLEPRSETTVVREGVCYVADGRLRETP